MNIFIIWPWWVWKSTTWKILSDKLWLEFIDLDIEYMNNIWDITNDIKTKWYEKYYQKNSDLFLSLVNKYKSNYVFALSSGFLTYTNDLTQKHLKIIKENWTSILLLPSKSLKESTEIIVKRQLSRWFILEYEREKEKFKIRFWIYKKYWDIKIFSHKPPNKISDKIIISLKIKFIL